MMESTVQFTDYRAKLAEEYLTRRSRNARYSVRSFARQLGVSKTALYEALAGKRHLSVKNAKQVAQKLVLSPSQADAMFAAIRGREANLVDSDVCLTDDTFRLMADWYHYAILNLVKMAAHRSSPKWIANRLGITNGQAREASQRLLRMGFLERDGARFKRRVGSLDTRPDFPSGAVKSYHRQQLRLAEQSLDRDAVEEREFCSLTLAIDSRDFLRIQKSVREFRNKISRTFSASSPDQVVQLAIQVFPVTQRRGKN